MRTEALLGRPVHRSKGALSQQLHEPVAVHNLHGLVLGRLVDLLEGDAGPLCAGPRAPLATCPPVRAFPLRGRRVPDEVRQSQIRLQTALVVPNVNESGEQVRRQELLEYVPVPLRRKHEPEGPQDVRPGLGHPALVEEWGRRGGRIVEEFRVRGVPRLHQAPPQQVHPVALLDLVRRLVVHRDGLDASAQRAHQLHLPGVALQGLLPSFRKVNGSW
mmetsp:Transcript_4265/g.12919  ORF Transcript_4265/g.12919 Transcript_4265/m.12919 type:complete len:217 (-) Transcript_4265:507-1157(-)